MTSLCASVSVIAGVLYLTLAGAPISYIGVNLVALLTGLSLAGFVTWRGWRVDSGLAGLLIAAALLATALFGVSLEGATRWLLLGPVLVQPSLILVPLLLLSFARQQDALSTCCVVVVALAVALQPDRAMCAVLLAGAIALLLTTRNRYSLLAAIAGASGLVASWLQPDSLPPVQFVEGVYSAAIQSGWLASAFVFGGTLLLMLPAIAAVGRRSAQARVFHVFGAVWLAMIAAAAFSNYPTPLVGYGSSAILGYTLCILGLPSHADVTM
ncbi:MAG: hypothetical protein AAFO81_09305 [Pseudomonadota bacterium]